MSIMKKLGVLIGVMLFATGMEVGQAAEADLQQIKFAVVNVQQVLQQSPRVAALSKQLEDQFKSRQTKLQEAEKSLQTEQEKLKKESPTLSQKDKDEMQKKISATRSDLVKQMIAYQQDLSKAQKTALESILSDLNGIVGHIAKSKNYGVVLDSQAVVYSVNHTDITKDVTEQFNHKDKA